MRKAITQTAHAIKSARRSAAKGGTPSAADSRKKSSSTDSGFSMWEDWPPSHPAPRSQSQLVQTQMPSQGRIRRKSNAAFDLSVTAIRNESHQSILDENRMPIQKFNTPFRDLKRRPRPSTPQRIAP